MHKIVSWVCYSASVGTLIAAISERDILEWTGVLIAAGASIFAFGLGRYHDFRKTQREEDHQDRLNMLEDVRVHTRILCEMETRQDLLKKSIEDLTIEISQLHCHFAADRLRDGSMTIHSKHGHQSEIGVNDPT